MERSAVRYIPRAIVSVLFLLSLLSCGRTDLQVLQGNYRHNKGEFARATISYMKALESGGDEATITYNLGNVYHSLGETDAAIETLRRAAEEGRWERAVFRSHYNLGRIYYQLGNFDRAVAHYIEALRVEPNDRDAKVNLELALQKLMGDEAGAPIAGASPKAQPKDLDAEHERLLELMKREEERSWERKQEREEEAPVNDW
jgi:Ca-activated chloride channel family protein